jgi:hypothetical protein
VDLAAGGERGDGEGGTFEDGVLGLRSLSSTGLVEAVVFGGSDICTRLEQRQRLRSWG